MKIRNRIRLVRLKNEPNDELKPKQLNAIDTQQQNKSSVNKTKLETWIESGLVETGADKIKLSNPMQDLTRTNFFEQDIYYSKAIVNKNRQL